MCIRDRYLRGRVLNRTQFCNFVSMLPWWSTIWCQWKSCVHILHILHILRLLHTLHTLYIYITYIIYLCKHNPDSPWYWHHVAMQSPATWPYLLVAPIVQSLALRHMIPPRGCWLGKQKTLVCEFIIPIMGWGESKLELVLFCFVWGWVWSGCTRKAMSNMRYHMSCL